MSDSTNQLYQCYKIYECVAELWPSLRIDRYITDWANRIEKDEGIKSNRHVMCLTVRMLQSVTEKEMLCTLWVSKLPPIKGNRSGGERENSQD